MARSCKIRLPRLRLAWLWLAAAAIILGAVLFGLGQLTALKQVKIEGNHTLTTAHVSQLTHQGLLHQLFGHNLVLVDTGALGAHLQQAEPGIKQVSIQRHLLHTLVVKVVERQPALNWKTNGSVYLLDTNATVIGPTDATYAHLLTVTDSSNLPVKVGDRVALTVFEAVCVDIARLLPGTAIRN